MFTCRPPPSTGGMLVAEAQRIHPLHADHADPPPGQLGHQLGKPRLLPRQRRKIEHHRPTLKEIRRPGELRIELLQPRLDRHIRHEHDSHERPATQAHEGTGADWVFTTLPAYLAGQGRSNDSSIAYSQASSARTSSTATCQIASMSSSSR